MRLIASAVTPVEWLAMHRDDDDLSTVGNTQKGNMP